jgi:hypothetical protein
MISHFSVITAKTKVLIMALALFVGYFDLLPSSAIAFGPVDETCPSSMTGLQPTPGTDLASVIRQLQPGSTLLLSAGRYTLSSTVAIPAGTAASPTTIIAARDATGQCAEVVIDMQGTLQTNNYVTIAGITLNRSANCVNGSSDCFQYKAIDVRNGSKNVAIRNNNIIAGGDLIYVDNNASDIQIVGNNLGGSKKWCIGVRGNPTNDVSIVGNRFDYCYDDNIQAENHKNLVISRNQFIGKSSDQILDIKVPKGNTTINHNVIDCRQNSDACVLFHANDYALSTGMTQIFANNTVLGCSSAGGKFVVMGGAKTYDYRDLTVEYNEFIDTDGSKCRVEFKQCDDCIFRHNTIYNGELEKYTQASGAQIYDNIFFKTTLKTSDAIPVCSHNVFFQVTGTLGTCTAGTFGNPIFANPPTALELAGSSSSAWKNASDGGNRGRWQGDINLVGSPTNLTVTNIP